MIQQNAKSKVFAKLTASLQEAREGSRDLDIIVSCVLGDTATEAGQMIQLLVEEEFPWDVISEMVDGDLRAYTTSLDAVVPGENILLSVYSRKRERWAALQKTAAGEQILAWGATECLARRLAALKSPRPGARPAMEPDREEPDREEPDRDESDREPRTAWKNLF